MTTIYLVRHGEVEGNSGAHRTFAGSRDLPLTPRGELQRQAVALRLAKAPLCAVYASTLQRAWRTAEAIAAPHGVGVQKLEALREVDYGDWEGLGEDAIARDWLGLWRERVKDPWNVGPPNGESYQALWARLEPAWNTIVQENDGRTVAIVGHNGSLRLLLCELLGIPPANARCLSIANASLTKVRVGAVQDVRSGQLEGPPVVVEYINQTSHLDGI